GRSAPAPARPVRRARSPVSRDRAHHDRHGAQIGGDNRQSPCDATGTGAGPRGSAGLSRFMNLKSQTAAPSPARVEIDLGDRSYPILIGEGLIERPETWAPVANPRATALIVTNTTVGPLYGDRLRAALAPHFAHVRTLALPDGEAFKDWQHLNL